MTALHSPDHWAVYNAAQPGRGVRALCREVMALAGPGAGRQAIDLGCGAGVESAALLAAGWRVHAVDGDPATPSLVRATAGGEGGDALSVAVVPFADLVLPPADLLYAGYSLPYASPDDFPRVWAEIRRALRPGAWLAVNLFGVHDSFAGTIDGTFLTRPEAEALFDGLDVVEVREEDEDGESFSGPKHWHVFDVLARVPR
ncbi:class I SAM-dependent methyltransferase [Oerskovia paurometabola]|uniref:class I SAM-dependent methyltransferase n=1 Tax=Oerskovia paurometabola TaxID=162170 RepID=UPI00341CEC27